MFIKMRDENVIIHILGNQPSIVCGIAFFLLWNQVMGFMAFCLINQDSQLYKFNNLKLAYVTVYFQVIFSMDDEYVPDYVDKKALVER